MSKKFTDLTQLTTPATNDILPIDDVSAGSTKKITAGDLLSTPLAVPTGAVQNDAITDAKLVHGKIRSRQGGSATDWTTPGTTTYDYSATNTFIQVGAKTLTAQTTSITFPTAFAQKPMIIVTPQGSGGLFSAGWYVVSITTTGFDIVCADYTKATPLFWMAIGE